MGLIRDALTHIAAVLCGAPRSPRESTGAYRKVEELNVLLDEFISLGDPLDDPQALVRTTRFSRSGR